MPASDCYALALSQKLNLKEGNARGDVHDPASWEVLAHSDKPSSKSSSRGGGGGKPAPQVKRQAVTQADADWHGGIKQVRACHLHVSWTFAGRHCSRHTT